MKNLADQEILNFIPLSAEALLEVSFNNMNLADQYLRRNPRANYLGGNVSDEIPSPIQELLDRLKNPSKFVGFNLPQQYMNYFDVAVLPEAAHHLIDLKKSLELLLQVVKPQGTLVLSIANASNWKSICQLIGGVAPKTFQDRPLSLSSTIEFLVQSGWEVMQAKQFKLLEAIPAELMEAFESIAKLQNLSIESLETNLSTHQWVVTASNGVKPKPITVAGLGMRKFAGVTEARVDHPLKALSSLPDVHAFWSDSRLILPKRVNPGVLILHRQLMNDQAFNDSMERMVSTGWLLVADMDDDPRNWQEYRNSNYRAFRGVHAVTVSTERLAALIGQWNPNVQVFSNCMFELPARKQENALREGDSVNIFYGALNRKADWSVVMGGIQQAALLLGVKLNFHVVHDREFFDALPQEVKKNFYETLQHSDYMKVLAQCHLALLPLNLNEFNLHKSDLKLVECASVGVVPICSPVIYGEKPEHHQFAAYANTPNDWYLQIVRLTQDEGLRESMSAKARKYVIGSRMHSQQTLQRKNFYAQLIDQREELEKSRKQRLQQFFAHP
jgi:hypothetical protein